MSPEAGAGERGQRVPVGRISGIYGVKGWVRVYSYTQPRENILNYSPWLLYSGRQWRAVEVLEGRRQGAGVIARLAGCEDRDAARGLMETEIAVHRSQLASSGADEYYWVDLIGLRVVNLQGIDLGRVRGLLETGAHDVLVVNNGRERLIPYVRDAVVTAIDLEAGCLQVDWDADWDKD